MLQIMAMARKEANPNAAEIKTVNQQINALQEELGRLREEIKCQKSYEKLVEREFVHCVVGEE